MDIVNLNLQSDAVECVELSYFFPFKKFILFDCDFDIMTWIFFSVRNGATMQNMHPLTSNLSLVHFRSYASLLEGKVRMRDLLTALQDPKVSQSFGKISCLYAEDQITNTRFFIHFANF